MATKQELIDGIIDKVSDSDHFEDVAWVLDAPIVNHTMGRVDDIIHKNVDLHAKAGLSPKVVRKEVGDCCDWCKEVVGTYEYPDVPADVYKRHDRCKCVVEYYPGDGRKQDVWSKEYINPPQTINLRKVIGLQPKNSIKVDGETISFTKGEHVFSNGLYGQGTKRKAIIYENKDGIKFIFKEGMDSSKQSMTPQMLIGAYNQMPKVIKDRSPKIIEVQDIYNPQDKYWKKQYKNFKGSYATGGDIITFWRYNGTHDFDHVVYTIEHESGHHIDRAIGEYIGNNYYTDSKGWKSAIDNDTAIGAKGYPSQMASTKELIMVSEYASRSDQSEDFADSIALWATDSLDFQNKYPNRAKIIKSILTNTDINIF